MTPKKFFTRRAIGFGILLIIGVGVWAYTILFSSPDYSVPALPLVDENTIPPTFAWSYENDTSLNPDGFPQTKVILVATYPSGVSQMKVIGVTPGGCNDVPDAELDSVQGTTTVQCYYAGLGDRFKITKGKNVYLVERQTFEEALPDYNPPISEYEVVAEFPLAN